MNVCLHSPIQVGYNSGSTSDPAQQSQDFFLSLPALVLQPSQEEALSPRVSWPIVPFTNITWHKMQTWVTCLGYVFGSSLTNAIQLTCIIMVSGLQLCHIPLYFLMFKYVWQIKARCCILCTIHRHRTLSCRLCLTNSTSPCFWLRVILSLLEKVLF